ncbi:MAG TPA: heparan-alpha-glucosaminide N-acetyltransferase domain-containing protein [Sphingomonas sp.]|nr:heparan-alpha-glucosaminide N-acetyltransferase domain-containing protein [Sphingomonas sp.]
MSGPTSRRLVVLDVLRGAAVAGMILVTSPGDWNRTYAPLKHADWHGWTLADMVFPTFLFAVGMAIGLSFPRNLSAPGARRQTWLRVFRRAAALILLGLALNWLYTAPIFDIPVVIGHPGLAFVRLPGVLQRIALCYVIATAFILAHPRHRPDCRTDLDPRWIGAVIMMILIVYGAMMIFVPVPGYGAGRLDPEGNLAAYVDRAIFTPRHLWPLGWANWGAPVVYDPEGLLSTLPATANVLIGVLAGQMWRHTPERAAPRIALAGVVLIGAGLLVDPIFPINKRIWTSSFALLSSGFSAVALALFEIALRSRTAVWLATPLRILGGNAVLAFTLSILLGKFSGMPVFHTNDLVLTPQAWGDTIARAVIPDEYAASLACALAVLTLTIFLLWPLHRRAIHFRL